MVLEGSRWLKISQGGSGWFRRVWDGSKMISKLSKIPCKTQKGPQKFQKWYAKAFYISKWLRNYLLK